MSRDFILVFSGGVVSLLTTFVVLFVMDWFYRRDHQMERDPTRQKQNVPPPETIAEESFKEKPST